MQERYVIWWKKWNFLGKTQSSFSYFCVIARCFDWIFVDVYKRRLLRKRRAKAFNNAAPKHTCRSRKVALPWSTVSLDDFRGEATYPFEDGAYFVCQATLGGLRKTDRNVGEADNLASKETRHVLWLMFVYLKLQWTRHNTHWIVFTTKDVDVCWGWKENDFRWPKCQENLLEIFRRVVHLILVHLVRFRNLAGVFQTAAEFPGNSEQCLRIWNRELQSQLVGWYRNHVSVAGIWFYLSLWKRPGRAMLREWDKFRELHYTNFENCTF